MFVFRHLLEVHRQLFITGIILIALLSPSQSGAHGLGYHEFRAIDHRLGMDAPSVYCVVQDNNGLIWFGTNRGLYNFDGYLARQYPAGNNIVKDKECGVYCAVMVDSVRLWLGTDDGLAVFNTYTDSYENPPGGMPENIRAITRINDHSFWIGSINGLYRYDSHNGRTEKINDAVLPHQAVYTILRYDEFTFYFGTYNGLCRYEMESNRFEKVTLGNGYSSSNQLILSLLPDYGRNCIWVGVEGELFSYEPSSGKVASEPILNGNSVKSLLLDNKECLWAGTDNGLYILDPQSGGYSVLRHDATNDRSLLNNVVWAVFKDREENIWAGTDAGASLYIYHDRFMLRSLSELTGSNEGNQIISMLVDSKQNLWLGGNNGLIKVDLSEEKTTWYQQNNRDTPIPHNKVRFLFEDADGDIWIATDGSICRYDETSSRFIRYQIEDATHTRNANWSYAICQDETRKLWIATCLGGVFVADKKELLASEGRTYIAERNYYSNGGAQGLSGNMLQFLAQDKNNNIWAATYRAGINKIDRMNNRVEQFTSETTKASLPSDDVTAMIADSDDYLWIALQNRIVRMDIARNTFRVISDPRLDNAYISALADDGKRIWMSLSYGLFFVDRSTLNIKQINAGSNYYTSVCYDKDAHRIIAGGINEYVEFDPETVLAEDSRNNIFLTSLSVNANLVQAGRAKSYPLTSGPGVRFTHAVELPYNQNSLSFTFSELNYSRLQNVQYASMLEGLDADWHFLARGDNRITYNNIPPGNYTLMISRIGTDGNPIPQPLTFTVKVNHPWYLTGVARTIYLILLLLFISALVNYFIVLSRLRYERIEKAKTMELTAHKIDFLTNISHELKTPLSLIIGPLEKIMEQVRTTSVKDQLADVRQNALKMSALIHRMMEGSRQEADGFGLIVSKTDMVAFVTSMVTAWEKALEERRIRIDVETQLPSLFIEADVLKIEVVLDNIMSNASRFAPDGSVITVGIDSGEGQVKLTVTDQGPGIDARDLPHVFERFFQSRHSLPQNRDGSGVGLSIVKEYVQLHHGSVRVLSDGENGTCVEVLLPVSQEEGEAETVTAVRDKSHTEEQHSKPLLLIVEDNVEIASFIANSLSHEFRCITAQNGRLGLEAAQKRHPDIIIADIMMPVMDGIEMCRTLKDNIATSLIPVVILTAKDDRDTERTGYRSGADAFISKPFEISYLSDRLHNLLKGHDMLVVKARQEAIIKPKEEDVRSPDEKFLATITRVIENEMTDPELNVNLLSERSGYSPKQVYRRIKSLTGQTAVDYIRSVRLRKAAMLLSRKTFTVTEVMYMVGFSNHSYFSKRFQEMFGRSPKSYAEDQDKNNA